MNTLHFTYDPLALIRITLQRHVEETIQGNFYKAKQFACYEYLRLLSDDALEKLLVEYVDRHNLEAITLKDWKTDARLIFDIIFETEDYCKLELDYKRKGFGQTGYGVIDKSDNTFYNCSFGEHWAKIRQIVEQKYPELQDPLDAMYFDERLTEYEGVTRESIESFIISNFELTGGTKPVHEYM
ncbi:hypothetical protein [Paenibacillus chitinolyticus]